MVCSELSTSTSCAMLTLPRIPIGHGDYSSSFVRPDPSNNSLTNLANGSYFIEPATMSVF